MLLDGGDALKRVVDLLSIADDILDIDAKGLKVPPDGGELAMDGSELFVEKRTNRFPDEARYVVLDDAGHVAVGGPVRDVVGERGKALLDSPRQRIDFCVHAFRFCHIWSVYRYSHTYARLRGPESCCVSS
jgi:hypothetical protein